MLSFLCRWDYCWKCEFDTDVKIDVRIFYHHDGEPLGFNKKGTSQNTEQEKGCSCNLYIARNEEF